MRQAGTTYYYSDRAAATLYISSEVICYAEQHLSATTATKLAVSKPVDPVTNTAGLQKHSRRQAESVS